MTSESFFKPLRPTKKGGGKRRGNRRSKCGKISTVIEFKERFSLGVRGFPVLVSDTLEQLTFFIIIKENFFSLLELLLTHPSWLCSFSFCTSSLTNKCFPKVFAYFWVTTLWAGPACSQRTWVLCEDALNLQLQSYFRCMYIDIYLYTFIYIHRGREIWQNS